MLDDPPKGAPNRINLCLPRSVSLLLFHVIQMERMRIEETSERDGKGMKSRDAGSDCPRILFVARKMPPVRGGMEKVAQDLFISLSPLADTELLTIRHGTRNPLFVIVLFWKMIFLLLRRRTDIIYLQDCMLAPLLILGRIFNIPTVIQAHGLDVTYKNWLYQHFLVPLIRIADTVTCVSEATRRECIARKVLERKTKVIPNGICFNEWDDALKEEYIPEDIKKILSGRYLISVGRLVPRKGFDWFVSEVFPTLSSRYDDLRYIIVGDGVLRGKLEDLIEENGLSNRVILFGGIDRKTLAYAYSKASIMISPNKKIPDDVEGFGIANIEASLFGVPVVASRVDGIPDAVIEGVTGELVKSCDRDDYVNRIVGILEKSISYEPSISRSETINKFGWGSIAKEYMRVFNEIACF